MKAGTENADGRDDVCEGGRAGATTRPAATAARAWSPVPVKLAMVAVCYAAATYAVVTAVAQSLGTVSATTSSTTTSTTGDKLMLLMGGDALAPVMRALEAAGAAMDGLHARMETAWNVMTEKYSPFFICGPITFLYHETVYFACYIPWLIMDQMPSMRKYKIQPTKDNDVPMHTNCLRRLFFSHVFVQFPMMLMFHLVVELFGFRIKGPLPAFSDLAWQVPVFLVIEDFYFYWVHRFLHWKKIYKYIHKVHHEHKAPFGITAEYAHPVETIVLGIGTLLGPVIFCRHLFTLWVYLAVRLWETVEDHAGYDVWFNPTNLIPFWGGPVHHDFHHKTFDGPYSSIFTYCDYLFGTDARWREHQLQLRRAVGKEESVFYPAVFRGAPHVKAD